MRKEKVRVSRLLLISFLMGIILLGVFGRRLIIDIKKELYFVGRPGTPTQHINGGGLPDPEPDPPKDPDPTPSNPNPTPSNPDPSPSNPDPKPSNPEPTTPEPDPEPVTCTCTGTYIYYTYTCDGPGKRDTEWVDGDTVVKNIQVMGKTVYFVNIVLYIDNFKRWQDL